MLLIVSICCLMCLLLFETLYDGIELRHPNGQFMTDIDILV